MEKESSVLNTKNGKRIFLCRAFSAVVVITKDNSANEYTATLLRPQAHLQHFADTHIREGVMSDKNFAKFTAGASTPIKIISTRKDLAGTVISNTSANRFKNTSPIEGYTASTIENAIGKLFEDIVGLPNNTAIQFKEGDTISYINVQEDGSITEQITTTTSNPHDKTAVLLQTTEIHKYNAWKSSKKPALKPIRS